MADGLAHGTRSRYNHHGCHCPECTEANRAWIEGWRRRRGVKPLRRGTHTAHGTRSRYNTGCRCDECRRANAEASRARRTYVKAGRG